MAGSVVLKPLFTMGPSSTDFTPVLSGVTFPTERTKVDDSRLNDAADTMRKGTYSHQITLNFKADSTGTLFKLWCQWYEAEDPIAFTYRRSAAAAESTANPTITGNAQITTTPPIGGERGALYGSGSITIPVTGALVYDDGTDTITFG